MTYRAVVKYALDDTPGQKRMQILEGLVDCAHELSELGVSDEDVARALDDAAQQFEADRESDRRHSAQS